MTSTTAFPDGHESPVLEAALVYHERGWCIVPVEPGTKRPACKWREYQLRQPSEEQLRDWFDLSRGGRFLDLAVVLGEISGRLAVRDFDDATAYDCWAEEHPDYARSLPTVKTAHGYHVYLRLPPVSTIKGIIKLPDGELRSDGGIVLLPPSRHPSGVRYEWVIPVSNGDLPEIDPEEIGLVSAKEVSATKSLPGLLPEGQRNASLTSLAGSMRRRGASEQTIRVALETENSFRCDPPLETREVANIARSIARYEPAVTANGVSEHVTELGNARRLIARHGQDLRYVGRAKKWYVWDGTRWRPDDTGEVYRRAKETVTSIYAEASATVDEHERKSLSRWAIKSEAENQIHAMITLAQSEPGTAILPDVFDPDPWSLNCSNGTLDLRAGCLRPHCREDLITKRSPIHFDSTATCPTWTKFLGRITNNDGELQSFLQRAVGYGLTGDTSEQVLFILYGSGGNGKSTFLEVVRLAAGDYSMHTPTETLMVKRTGGIPNDLARLAGARLVTAVEVEDGHRMAESVVKQLTGSDTVTARFLNREFFDFSPQCKLFLSANHKPQIRGTDTAIWRRIRLVPFTVTISEEERDKHLIEKLRPELPGILRWAVEGCREWQRVGLGEPSLIRNATDRYRQEMDLLGQFITERCVVKPEGSIGSKAIYAGYTDWCEQGREQALTQAQFSRRLGGRGFEKNKIHGVMHWQGITLAGDPEDCKQ